MNNFEFPCRDQTYFTNCVFDDCISYDAIINGFYYIKDYLIKVIRFMELKV